MNVERRLRITLLAVSAAVSGLTLAGVLLIVGIGLSQALKGPTLGRSATSFEQVLVFALILGTLLSALGAFGLAWWVSKSLSRVLVSRLDAFIRFTRVVGGGDLSARMAVHESDELGELAYAFNHMTEGLQTSERERETFLAAVAHDLRTPLTTLRGNIEAMLAGVIEPGPERLAMLHEDTSRLTRLVEDLLLLASARAQALPIRTRPLNAIAHTRRLVDRFSPLAQARSIALRMVLQTDLIEVSVDPDRLDQILINLISNALRYTRAGGHVDVALNQSSDGSVLWTVSDDGPGIATDMLPHVTEPFYRGDVARGREGGFGLGLATADALTKAHGGTLTIRSSSHGTQVQVTIPQRLLP